MTSYWVSKRDRLENLVVSPKPVGSVWNDGDGEILAVDDGVVEGIIGEARLALVHPAVPLPRVVDLQVPPPQHVFLEPTMGVLVDVLKKCVNFL